MQKLDEGIRWVNGVRIDVKTEKGINTYFKVLKEAQALSEKIGYGSNKVNWDEIYYSNIIRRDGRIHRID